MAFNARKAAQVIAYLAMKTDTNSLNIMKTIKLVYLADRESIAKWGFPIIDDNYVSMPHGPVNSKTYSHINGESDLSACGWADFLEDKEHHTIALSRQISVDDLDELSDADTQCMDAVWDRFGHMNEWQIRDWTHEKRNIPEWEDPHGSSREIPLERIMFILGIEGADEQASLIRDHRQIENLFKSLSK